MVECKNVAEDESSKEVTELDLLFLEAGALHTPAGCFVFHEGIPDKS